MKMFFALGPLIVFLSTSIAVPFGNKVENLVSKSWPVRPLETPVSYDQEFPSSLVRGFLEKETEMKQADNYLKWFVRDLKEYVANTKFLYDEFETQIESLRRDLSDIEFLVEKEWHNDELLHQLIFARRLYQAMVDATEKMQRYNTSRGMGHALLYKIIEFKVRVLVLHDYKGNPDCLIYRPQEVLWQLFRQLKSWKRDMGYLRHVPSGMVKLFDAQSDQTEEILISLKKKFSLCEEN